MSGTSELYAVGAAMTIALLVLAAPAALRRARPDGMESRIPSATSPLVGFALVATTVVILAAGALEIQIGLRSFNWGTTPGIDFDIYRGASQRLLTGQSWFLDRQLHGPYQLMLGDVLYPPVAAIVFAPFIVLPGILWWAIPNLVTTAVILRWRPVKWTWPLIAMCVVWPFTLARTITGNPAMWLMAFTALGLLRGWPGAFVAIKPTALPFALLGARNRWWWIGIAALAIATVALPEGIRYPAVLIDTQAREGWLYGLVDLPVLAIPVLAWAGRTTQLEPAR